MSRTHFFGPLSNKMRRMVAQWVQNTAGATMVVYAVMAIPLLGFVGAAVDYSRLHSARVELQNALDLAALAGARAYENTVGDAAARQAAAVKAAGDYFDANFPAGFQKITTPTLSVVPTTETVAVSATATMPTAFMQLLGISDMAVEADTVVQRSGRGVELVLVMDNTGSMRSTLSGESVNKMETMKASAATLVNILYGDRETIDNFYVALVPYAAMVNVGPTRTGWVNSVYERDGLNNGKDIDDLFDGTSWKGCVMARDGTTDGVANDSSDEPPSTKLWDVMSWPSTKGFKFKDEDGNVLEVDPDTVNDPWNYEENPDTGNILISGDNQWPPIDEANSSENDGTGPNLGCPQPIAPLMQPKTDVQAEISNMQPWHRGGTMGNLGLAWGWRTISPKWRGVWGAPTPDDFPLDYEEVNWEKVVIMLTDGENQWYDWPGKNKYTNESSSNNRTPLTGVPGNGAFKTGSSVQIHKNDVDPGADYTAYGRVDDGYLTDDPFNWGDYRAKLDAKMASVCQAMLDKGIIMFTITYGVNDTGTKNLFKNCAGRPDRYFNSPTNDDLLAAFIAIATEINNLRIAH